MANALLSKLTSKDVQELLNVKKMCTEFDDEIEFLYSVDFHEISDYCFPFGLRKNSVEVFDLDYTADLQIALQTVFNHKIFFLDQYISEYVGLRQKLSRVFSKEITINTQNLINSIQENNLTGLSENQSDYMSNFIKNNLSVIISLLTGIADNGLEKLSRLGKEKILLKSVQIELAGYDQILIEAFEINQSSQLAHRLFEETRQRIKIHEQDPHKQQILLTNAITDCLAVDRLLNINKWLYLKYMEKKNEGKPAKLYIILFVSSVERVRDLSRLNLYQDQLYSIGSDSTWFLNPYRHPAQFLLETVCQQIGIQSDSLMEDYKNYLLEEEYSKTQIQRRLSKPNVLATTVQNRLNQLVDEKRREFQFIGLLSDFITSKSEIDKVLLRRVDNFAQSAEKQLLPDAYRIIDTFEKAALQILNNTFNEKHILEVREKALMLGELPAEARFRNKLKEGIITLRSKAVQPMIELLRGKDHIQSTYQHLPIGFYVDADYKNLLENIIDVITPPVVQSASVEQLIFAIDDPDSFLYQEAQPITFLQSEFIYNPDYEAKLIRFILYMILPPDKDIRNKNGEKEICNEIKGVILSIEKDIEIEKLNLDENQLVHFESILMEYLYLVSWLLRRSIAYDEAEAYALKGLIINSNDGRFYHSLALIYYCKALDEYSDLPKRINLLKTGFEYSEKTLKLYESTNFDFTVKVKDKLIVAVHNTAAYLATFLAAEFSENFYLIAYNHLQRFKELEPDYFLYPEFLQTEAHFFYKLSQSDFKLVEQLQGRANILKNAQRLMLEAHKLQRELRRRADTTMYATLLENIEKALSSIS